MCPQYRVACIPPIGFRTFGDRSSMSVGFCQSSSSVVQADFNVSRIRSEFDRIHDDSSMDIFSAIFNEFQPKIGCLFAAVFKNNVCGGAVVILVTGCRSG